jgi:hypothetical protein
MSYLKLKLPAPVTASLSSRRLRPSPQLNSKRTRATP